MRRLTREEARRIAVRAQLLDADRPRDLGSVIQRLTFLQLDPTAAIAPSADLVAWTRLGNGYAPADLERALDTDRTVFEHDVGLALVRPMEDLRLFLADMAAWPSGSARRLEWMAANDGFRRRVLDQLRDAGPLASRGIADTSALAWESTGWRNDRNVTQMLQFMAARGEVAISGRVGRQRLWDLAERVYPADVEVVPAAEAQRIRDERTLRALGIARPRVVGEAGIAAEVEGTAGEWRVDPDATAEGFRGRAALLSPFDRLVHDRGRAHDLFAFEYTLEMYKPASERRWGYFALPVLHEDRLVGKVDATADRRAARLDVRAVHEDAPFSRELTDAVHAELDTLASWLGLNAVRYG